MVANARIVDASFLVALLNKRDKHNKWAVATANSYPPFWLTCEAVLSETLYFLEARRAHFLVSLLERGTLRTPFSFQQEEAPVLALMKKYADVPMSFADACLVRMSEVAANPIILTTDTDFRIYRRHSRKAIPSAMPR